MIEQVVITTLVSVVIGGVVGHFIARKGAPERRAKFLKDINHTESSIAEITRLATLARAGNADENRERMPHIPVDAPMPPVMKPSERRNEK